ncbi:MAG: tail fiber domain-containing protein [Candidatus Bathyarchaeia archaeon]
MYIDGLYIRTNTGFVADGTIIVGTYGSGGTGSALYCNAYHQICQGTSLRAYKTNVETLDDASWIYNLHPVTFDWKDDKEVQVFGRQIGLIAEEVQPYAPLLTFNDDQTGKLRA